MNTASTSVEMQVIIPTYMLCELPPSKRERKKLQGKLKMLMITKRKNTKAFGIVAETCSACQEPRTSQLAQKWML